MDPSPGVSSHASDMHLFHGGSSHSDPDLMEVPQSSWNLNNQKRKRAQKAVPHEVIEIDEDDDDSDGVMIIGETLPKTSDANIKFMGSMLSDIAGPSITSQFHDPFTNSSLPPLGLNLFTNPNFPPFDSIPKPFPNPNFPPFDSIPKPFPNPNFPPFDSIPKPFPNPNFPPFDSIPKPFTAFPTLSPFDTIPKPFSNPNFQSPTPNPEPITTNPSLEDFNFSDYEYFEEDEDDYFDEDDGDDDLEFDPNPNHLAAEFDNLDFPPIAEASSSWMQQCSNNNNNNIKGEINSNCLNFKQFDTVVDCTDHYFMRPDPKALTNALKPPKGWAKRIQNEWKLLEKDLPESIYVRVYEERMDLMRACIVGPAGTPYHDGLFFFDVYFQPSYPLVPPLVHYHSGGLRLNPNLYACGKVCLSLLNTWSGTGCEKWNPANSTMLQVFVSIQALVLNAQPYFNEPGYVGQANTPHGEQKSLAYNETTFLLSCKTMLYSLRRPPKHFEQFVEGHFRANGHLILSACKAYMEGAQVGCVIKGVQDVDEGDKSCSFSFKTNLKRLFDDLLMEFTVKGANCDAFLNGNVRNGGVGSSSSGLVLGL